MDWPKTVSANGTLGETETPQAHWNWNEHQRQETTLKHDYRTWSPSQTVQPKQSLEPGVASARSDEGDSGIEDDDIQNNSDATTCHAAKIVDLCFEFAAASCVLPREVG